MDVNVELFSIQDYLNSRRIEYLTEGKNVKQGWIEVKCPFCDDPSFHLGINLSSNFISCWRCGVKGSIIKVVQKLERLTFQEALEVLEKFPRPYSQPEVDPNKYLLRREFKLPEKFSRIVPNDIPSGAARFLRSRGFDPKTIVSQKELYFADYNSYKYCLRLIIPIFLNRRMVSFVARDTTGKARIPYINCPSNQSSFPVKETLYGYDEVSPGSKVVIVEGIIDQWKLGGGALATYGTRWTEEQIQLIKTLKPSKVFTLYDTEPEAQKSAVELSKRIWFADTENLVLEDHKDPGELDLKEGEDLMKELTKT